MRPSHALGVVTVINVSSRSGLESRSMAAGRKVSFAMAVLGWDASGGREKYTRKPSVRLNDVERRLMDTAIEALVQIDDDSGWLLMADPVRVVEARAPHEVLDAIGRAEQLAALHDCYAAWFVRDEAGAAFRLAVHDDCRLTTDD